MSCACSESIDESLISVMAKKPQLAQEKPAFVDALGKPRQMPKKSPVDSAPTFFATPAAFRQWLQQNAASAQELVVGFHKVDSGEPSMSWSESVDEALCFGWIDGVRKRLDDANYQIRFTARRPSSIWSAVNIAKYEKLVREQRMTAAGVEAFGHRKEHKSVVYAYEQAGTAELSPDEVKAFKREQSAWDFFKGSAASYRKVVLHWIRPRRGKKPGPSGFQSCCWRAKQERNSDSRLPEFKALVA
jgi:uncharacterized protein YdeI (YjbR/CyaY-like superfamily)